MTRVFLKRLFESVKKLEKDAPSGAGVFKKLNSNVCVIFRFCVGDLI